MEYNLKFKTKQEETVFNSFSESEKNEYHADLKRLADDEVLNSIMNGSGVASFDINSRFETPRYFKQSIEANFKESEIDFTITELVELDKDTYFKRVEFEIRKQM